MPTTKFGEVVEWRRSANKSEAPQPAIVMETTPAGILTVAVFAKNGREFQTYTGCYHISDEIAKRFPERKAGFWDFRDGKAAQAPKQKAGD